MEVEIDSGWERSAGAWVACIDEGERNRVHVLDGPMLDSAGAVEGLDVVDIGCGEGRFCRMLAARGARVTGIDPTLQLLAAARERLPGGAFVEALAEELPFPAASFDLAVMYVVLIDIPDYRAAILEAARVLRPGGRLLVANLNPFTTTRPTAWVKDEKGAKLFVPVDNYFDERAFTADWAGIRIAQFHRPMGAYMSAFLGAGLVLKSYLEPKPSQQVVAEVPHMEDGTRVPYFHVMLWVKP